MIPVKKVKEVLRGQGYALVGEHSAVQICRWTKNSLNKKGVCWKEKFYGIKSHRCCQFSPSVMWCENQCLHCWRPIEMNLGTKLPKNLSSPKEIIEGIVEARKKLLTGFKGNKNVSAKKFEEACEPTLFTLSLSGEATLYPRIGELIQEIRKRNAVSFLVTNGLNPEVLKRLGEENYLPTQITVSTNAPNEKLFKIWHRSSKKNAWRKFNETLDVLKSLEGRVRRVVRLTLVKKGEGKFGNVTNMTKENLKEYSSLIKKANPSFVHIKGFMSVGYSRERMGYDKMPWHHEVKIYAEQLVDELNKNLLKKEKPWKLLGEEERSCIVLVGKDKKEMKIKKV